MKVLLIFIFLVSIHLNLVIRNFTGPSVIVHYNHVIVITVKVYLVKKLLGTKISLNFVHYSRNFVIAVIIITEFDCIAF